MTDYSDSILASFAGRMRSTPQPAEWHGEGDVLTHTEMVCGALRSVPEYRTLPEEKKIILMTAAKLHDTGKIITTRKTGDIIEAPHHAPAGSRLARESLWRAGLCGKRELMARREAICSLIRYHSVPPHIIDNDDAATRLHRIAANGLLAPDFSIRMLCILAEADMLGRICPDKEQMLLQIALCRELAEEEGCLDGCFRFPSEHTMHRYLNGSDVWKDQELFDHTWGTVYIMSGLPGTGKDTWIKRSLPDIPMVSLDDLRRELRVAPTADQGYVANIAREKAREYLRRHQSFVWNATDLTRSMRRQLVGLFESYKARVHIIYLETDWQTLLERNNSRNEAVPRAVIEAMLHKLEIPESHEAARVEWICT